MSSFLRATRLLDEVQQMGQLARFDSAAVLAAAREEAPPPGGSLADLERLFEDVRGLLGAIDRFTQKAMRLRLLPISDVIPRQLYVLVHSTITAYERDLQILRGRIARAAGEHTDEIMGHAEQVLAERATLRARTRTLAQDLAAGWIAPALKAVRDKSQPDEQRDQWKRAHVDLQALADDGARIETGSFAERLAAIPTPDDPPDEERPHRFELIEFD